MDIERLKPLNGLTDTDTYYHMHCIICTMQANPPIWVEKVNFQNVVGR